MRISPQARREPQGEEGRLPEACLPESYGAETVAPSPAAEIVNVPRAALMAKLYALPHAVLGGVGIAAMNGPAVMFCAFVAMAVSRLSALGSTPMCAPQTTTADARP